MQRERDRRYGANRDQRPADRSPLLAGQFFRKQQRDARTKHCARASNETDLRNGDFVLFHLLFLSFDINANPSQKRCLRLFTNGEMLLIPLI